MKNIFLFSLLVFCLSACTATRNNDGKSIFYEEMRKCSHLVDLFEKADYKIIPLGIDSLAIPAVGMKFLAHQNYFLVSDDLKDYIINAEIDDEILGSDHCPVILELEL